MSEMIERVAKAICKSRTCEGISCCQWPAQAARKIDCPVARGGYDDAARDAIKAMREPTEKMKSAGAMNLPDYDPSDADAELCWQNMIDEALK